MKLTPNRPNTIEVILKKDLKSCQTLTEYLHAFSLCYPKARPLLMCICSGENKKRDKNAAQNLMKH